MDGVATMIMDTLVSLGSDTKYVVVGIDEIDESTDAEMTKEVMTKAIQALIDQGYIAVKFFDNDNICYKVMRKISPPIISSYPSSSEPIVTKSRPKIWKYIILIASIYITSFASIYTFFEIFVW